MSNYEKWSKIVDLINLRQLYETMGDGLSTYHAKALKVKQVSQNKKVHALADSIIETYQLANSVTTYETKTEVASKLNSLFGVSK